jgi:hypothetical protein
MSTALTKGAIVNVVSFKHLHVESLFKEGLWGFPKGELNQKRWKALEPGMPILFYGDLDGIRGIFLKTTLENKIESYEPIKYWIQNPTGYPFQIRVKIESDINLKRVQPVKKEELASSYGIPIFKQKTDRWSLIVFGEKGEGITYPITKFHAILTEFNIRNKRIVIEKPDHESLKEILYQMGIIQKRISEKEVMLDSYRIDVAWRRIPRGDPYIVFEIHISGNLEEALTKLKHAHDMWNSQPLVLVTTEENITKAKSIIDGSFHEIKDKFRIIDWKEIKQAYELKSKYKELEAKLGIF